MVVSLVPRPLIQCVYCLQYNAQKNVRDTESDPRWGWFGSGTETTLLCARNGRAQSFDCILQYIVIILTSGTY